MISIFQNPMESIKELKKVSEKLKKFKDEIEADDKSADRGNARIRRRSRVLGDLQKKIDERICITERCWKIQNSTETVLKALETVLDPLLIFLFSCLLVWVAVNFQS